MSDLVAVEFIEHSTPYVKGEIAGFESEVAKDLIKKKVAKAYKQGKEKEREKGKEEKKK